MLRRLFIMLMTVIAALILTTSMVFARSNDSTPETVIAKHRILTLRELFQQDLITSAQEERGTSYYLAQATKSAGRVVTLEEVMEVPDPSSLSSPVQLTPLQQFAGLITFVNTLWVLAIVVGVGSFAYLFWSYAKALLRSFLHVPVFVYEALFYAISAGFLAEGWILGEPLRTSMSLAGCLLFATALGFTRVIRAFTLHLARFSAFVFVVWMVVAVIYESSLLGFIAVGALLSALSFSEQRGRDEWTVGRATGAAFALLTLFVLLHFFSTRLPRLALFEFGAFFLGSLVGYFGLLVLSNRWYSEKRNYVLYQAVSIVAGLAALLIGSVLYLPELQKIGGTFFVLYVIAKLIEIPAKSRRGYAAIGCIVAILVFGFCLLVFTHQATLRPFLFISG